ncbi:short chain dehydrogenase [Colletotrichum nymphaeae SA-01]|uniref:About the patent is no further information available n=1 Tax=Colletotrichum nymphaeae SA-01 TaxID=1460502 RepID=A0A135TBQ9_9PEZI|nr:short chain dehydrogenase [Colletotrichum nymphaeae SA-01]
MQGPQSRRKAEGFRGTPTTLHDQAFVLSDDESSWLVSGAKAASKSYPSNSSFSSTRSLHRAAQIRRPYRTRRRPPNGLQIVQDQDLVGKLPHKVILVTGVSSGLGIETLKALAATGATVYGTARDLSKARAALDENGDDESLASAPNIHLLEMDLASLDSVRAAAADFKRRSDRLDILINNAGVMYTPEGSRTKDGFEMQFGVNHLAHFLLFTELRDLMASSSTPGSAARIVNVTSSGHRLQEMNWSDVNFSQPGAYEGYRAYGQSKTANILMANGVDRRYGRAEGGGIHGYSVHPGTAMTGLPVEVKEQMEALRGNEAAWRTVKSPAQGAATAVLAALGKEFEGRGPFYLEDCEVKGETRENLGWMGEGYASWAWDRGEEERLWALSLEMVGLPREEGGDW